QVQRVVAELAHRLRVPALRALLPGVGQRDDVVDLDVTPGLRCSDSSARKHGCSRPPAGMRAPGSVVSPRRPPPTTTLRPTWPAAPAPRKLPLLPILRRLCTGGSRPGSRCDEGDRRG